MMLRIASWLFLTLCVLWSLFYQVVSTAQVLRPCEQCELPPDWIMRSSLLLWPGIICFVLMGAVLLTSELEKNPLQRSKNRIKVWTGFMFLILPVIPLALPVLAGLPIAMICDICIIMLLVRRLQQGSPSEPLDQIHYND